MVSCSSRLMSMLVKWGGRAVTAPSRGGAGSRRPPFNGPPDTGGFEEGISSLAGSWNFVMVFLKDNHLKGKILNIFQADMWKVSFVMWPDHKRGKKKKIYILFYLYPLKILIRFWNLFWEEIIMLGFNIFLIKPVSLFHTVYVCTLNNGRELWNWLYKLQKTYKNRTQNNKIFFFKIIFFISLIATLRGFFNEEK